VEKIGSIIESIMAKTPLVQQVAAPTEDADSWGIGY
jgi:hypothetical protein